MSKVTLLICQCESCSHWEITKDEIGQMTLLCKTCGLEVPARVEFDEHEKLAWKEHER
jgi:hypothetical protein